MTRGAAAARRSLAAVAFAAAAMLAGCGIGAGAERDCEEMWESLSASVDGVIAVDFECRRTFGNPGEEGVVTVTATTETEAVAVMEDVLRAYAASADLGDASQPVLFFTSEDGSIGVGPTTVGFNGMPSLRQIREHYGIQP